MRDLVYRDRVADRQAVHSSRAVEAAAGGVRSAGQLAHRLVQLLRAVGLFICVVVYHMAALVFSVVAAIAAFILLPFALLFAVALVALVIVAVGVVLQAVGLV